jgi:hypothetical protein
MTAAAVVSATVTATTDPDPHADRRAGRRLVDLARRRTTNHHDIVIVAHATLRRRAFDALGRIRIDALDRRIGLLQRRC